MRDPYRGPDDGQDTLQELLRRSYSKLPDVDCGVISSDLNQYNRSERVRRDDAQWGKCTNVAVVIND